MTVQRSTKFTAVLEHTLVFAGDLLPYGIMFLLTLMVGYGLGLESAAFFSMTYVYVAVVTAVVCGPNLLSLKRRMPVAVSPGAVVAASLSLRAAVICIGAALVIGLLYATKSPLSMISLMLILFVGRLFETAVDGPATSVQYLRGAGEYFFLRLLVFVLICCITGLGSITSSAPTLMRIALSYLVGSAVGFFVTLTISRHLLFPISGVKEETRAQASEFGKFFLATVLFLAASRLHPMIIHFFSGHKAAGQFAMVQNLFSVVAVAAGGVAGLFFWSRNREVTQKSSAGIPWRWLAGAIPGGLALGAASGAAMDVLYLRPLGSTTEVRTVAWLLCASTPFLIIQAILSNQLVLQKRDREMLTLSALSAAAGLLLITLLVYKFGLFGAALSVSASAIFSTLLGIFIMHRAHE
ncbi:polysaccharide biosynthesis C-terminal domain-containing protein [Paucibacter sp. TC2R-5]|uniref:polysaccharide biosynthesis C-terminal domain-containing protein n=1 Tax=Paucibacter sp. TC2R-5 TaxID=2893555 RepID=UPI0021E3AB31|nr:polysaccharide biosynthesis C-terminal domain-containing protein [Paucibacter sp. TC2R-5]MCV2361780.1 polysaccharide biosynthesis C-terminal domain-containing protein [Paucibacter sp. TC2R-5]